MGDIADGEMAQLYLKMVLIIVIPVKLSEIWSEIDQDVVHFQGRRELLKIEKAN